MDGSTGAHSIKLGATFPPKAERCSYRFSLKWEAHFVWRSYSMLNVRCSSFLHFFFASFVIFCSKYSSVFCILLCVFAPLRETIYSFLLYCLLFIPPIAASFRRKTQDQTYQLSYSYRNRPLRTNLAPHSHCHHPTKLPGRRSLQD